MSINFVGKYYTEHKQEVLELITNLIKTKNPKNIAESISGIYSGCQGMHYSINDYITYISKTPVTGFFLLPDQAPEEKDFDAYINAYDNLIMSVSSFHDLEKNTYQHRGIFRNPISMIRRDYQGLGILIHAFTGLAWSVKSPNVKYMIVNPDGNYYMRSLLEKIFNEEEKGFTLEDARDLPNSYIIVKIDALKSRFPLFQ